MAAADTDDRPERYASRLVGWAVRTFAGLGVGGALLLAGWLLFPALLHKPADETARPAVSAPEVKRAPVKQAVIKQPVKYFAGDTKAKLKLPASVGADEQVIASSRVKSSDRPVTVTTTINTETGAVASYVKHEDYPLFAIEPRGEARLSLGYRYDGSGQVKTVARLAVSYDLIRVKAVVIGATGSVDSDGRAFVGAGVAYRW